MNADLEETLKEMGPEYRPVVDRLLAGCGGGGAPAPSASHGVSSWPAPRLRGTGALTGGGGALAPAAWWGWRTAALLAASLVVGLGAAWYFTLTEGEQAGTPALRESPYVLAYSADAASVAALVRTQRADGSWANDFLTRQNAAALRTAPDEAAHVAYRRALRYLRAKGLAPLTADELRARVAFAAQRQGA